MTHFQFLFLLKPTGFQRIFTVIIWIAGIITFQNSAAQDQASPVSGSKPLVLSQDQWKKLEGYFQSVRNQDMVVHFFSRVPELHAKLLWNDNEISLIPESDSTFISRQVEDDGPIRIRFFRDAAGVFAKLAIGNNNDIWIRTLDYKPVVKLEMDHSPEQLKPFEGLYSLSNAPDDRFIQFAQKDNRLILRQHWDGNEISFVPSTPLDFFSRDVPLFSLTFSKDQDGNIKDVLAFKKDLWIRVKKVSISAEQMRAFEGRYQFKDDPDNLIQVSAAGNRLVIKQLWDKKEITVDPQTPTYFYNYQLSYPVQFTKNSQGIVTQVMILGLDRFDKLAQ